MLCVSVLSATDWCCCSFRPSQVKADLKRRVREDSDFNSQQFPNAHRAFSSDS